MILKKELRNSFLEQRNNMPECDIKAKSEIIKHKLFGLEEYRNSKQIFTYVNMGNEVITTDIINQALTDGKVVAVPKIIKKDNTMIFVEIQSLEELRVGHFNVLEPISCEQIESDLQTIFLVPGAVFDLKGYRIGYGGGYYDRYLSNAKALYKIGLAYDFQRINEIPKEEYDIAVDCVITDDGLKI
jgi:5-formyltetrahydrofolate cyclo-ligase